MKFYYNNKLVRTSKNHEYTHAIIDMKSGECIGCRTSYEACQSFINTELNGLRRNIENSRRKIKALEAGKTYYIVQEARRSWRHDFTERDTVGNSLDWIKRCEEMIADWGTNWQIVELEAR